MKFGGRAAGARDPRGRSSRSIWRAARPSPASGSPAAPLLPGPPPPPPPGFSSPSSSSTASSPCSFPLFLPLSPACFPGLHQATGERRRPSDSQINPADIPAGLHPDWQQPGPVGALGSALWPLGEGSSASRGGLLRVPAPFLSFSAPVCTPFSSQFSPFSFSSLSKKRSSVTGVSSFSAWEPSISRKKSL